VPYESTLADRFLDALERELDGWPPEAKAAGCETLYIGGGTPSVLSESQWERLLSILRPVTRGGVQEWTVEANPGALRAATVKSMDVAGVNRISMGVQSFDDAILETICRRHSAADVAAALDVVRAAGISNVGLDLIAGLPGVDANGWLSTLTEAVALDPAHLSVYALGLEPGSRLYRQSRAGEVVVPHDDAVTASLNQAEAVLAGKGYRRYEISNYAKPGRECLHNLSCWRGNDYVGLGPAASSRVGLNRSTHKADLDAYCAALEAGSLPPAERECVDERTDLCERLIFGLRLEEGVAFRSRCDDAGAVGRALWERWQPGLKTLCEQGLLLQSGDCWKATRRGHEVLDSVLAQLVGSSGDDNG
jgi:oxygen-independent coproporphyrinogen-3 oxidase